MRLFLAIHLSDSAIDHLRTVQARLRSVAPDLTYTRDVNLHLTVRFLGEVKEDKLDALKETIRRTAEAGLPMKLACNKLISFPWQKPANVIAAQVGGEAADQLVLTQSALERAIRSFAQPENQKYTPHVTLARPAKPLPLPIVQRMINETQRSWPGPVFEARRIHLVESQPSPAGSKYRSIADFDLFG